MTPWPMPTRLQCCSLTMAYRQHVVLDQVSFDLKPGEWLSLIGPNGAGKSSLLKAIKGLVRFGGDIKLGVDQSPGSFRTISAKDVAYVPQNPIMPDQMSVAEYVLLGRTAHLGWFARESENDRQVVAKVLQRLELGPFARRSVDQLSGGEYQRVVLARALAQQSTILLLDEPTSALDPGHQVGVLDLVDELRCSEGITVMAAMHDLTTAARYGTRLMMLNHGRVEAIGDPQAVLEPERLSMVYGTPMNVTTIDGDMVVIPKPRGSRRSTSQ